MDIDTYRREIFPGLSPESLRFAEMAVQWAGDGRSELRVRGLFLRFTPETAGCWGGPWPGDVAVAELLDYRRPSVRWPHQLLPLDDHIQASWKVTKKYSAPRLRPEERHMHEAPEWYVRSYVQENATIERPVRLYLSGNDDTSYSKFFEELAPAEEELALLEACEPLDFHRDLLGLGGWVFTN